MNKGIKLDILKNHNSCSACKGFIIFVKVVVIMLNASNKHIVRCFNAQPSSMRFTTKVNVSNLNLDIHKSKVTT